MVTEGEGECCSTFLDSFRFLEPEVEPVLMGWALAMAETAPDFQIASFRLASVDAMCRGTFCSMGNNGIRAVRIWNC